MEKPYQNAAVTLTLLAVLIANSVFTRLPSLDRPLGRPFEFVTAHLLVTLSVWDKGGGPSAYHFAPVFTFPEPGNKNIDYFGGLTDARGDCYYVSYPPFAFLFAYYALALVGAPFTPLSAQILSLVIHAATALLFFSLLLQLFARKLTDKSYLPALVGFTLYLFNPSHLWLHGNVLFVDTVIQPLFLAQVFLLLHLVQSDKAPSGRLLAGIFVVNFLAIYTEWLGLFTAAGGGFVCLWRWARGDQRYFAPMVVHLAVGVSALGLILFQYASIAGLEAFLVAAVKKFRGRSGLEDTGWNFNMTYANSHSFARLGGMYEFFYSDFWPYAATIGLVYLALLPFIRKLRWSPLERGMLAAFFLPVLIHHALFFNFTVQHGFATLKTSFFFFLLVAVMLAHFSSWLEESSWSKVWQAALIVGLIGFVIQAQRNYAKVWERQPIPPEYAAVGSQIQKHAEPENVVFTNMNCAPETMYYAQRNIQGGVSRKDAAQILRTTDRSLGLYIAVTVDERTKKSTLTTYELRSDGKYDELEVSKK